MTLTLSMLITADAKGAKAELATTATEAKKLGAATTDAGGKARTAGTGVNALGGASAATAAKVTALANAEAAAGVTAVKMGQSHTLAAGSVGNLTAQFNDIGMMLAAGQNPLQLALQQGTQISQVIGPMGAAGAVKALGSALLGMVSPVSLITIGSIAAGAAMFQWLTGASDEVVTLDDLLETLATSVSAFDSAMSAATTNADDLIAGYGEFAGAAQKVLAVQAEIANLDALRALNSAVGNISTTFGSFSTIVSDSGDTLRDNYMDTVNRLAGDFDITRFQASALADALRDVGTAEGPEAQVDALARAREQIELASGGLSEMSDEARVVYDGLLQAELAAAKLAGINIAAGVAAAADEATRLAKELGISLATAASLARMGPQGVPNSNSGYKGKGATKPEVGRGGAVDPRTVGGTGRDYDLREADAFLANWKPPRVSRSGSGRGGSGGGGTSEIEKQRKALDDLIEREERELAILRETDPLKKEMLRNREAMAGATDAERAKVEELISTRMREKDVMEEIRDRTAEFGNVGEQAFKGLITGAHGLKGALSMVLDKMADMVASSAWDALWGGGSKGGGLGGLISGGLSAIFGGGGKGGGDLFANIGGAVKKADGGKIGGSGGPREDNIPIWASSGEFMINAAATAQHQPLLEAINGGASPRQIMAMASGARAYADGGMIGGSAPSAYRGGGAMFGNAAAAAAPAATSGGGAVAVRVFMDKGGEWKSEVQRIAGEIAVEMMQGGLEEFSRTAMPGRVAEINRQPWKRG
jgi:hypothetical protein